VVQHTVELVSVGIEVPIPCLAATLTVVQSMDMVLLVHHSSMAVGADASGQELGDQHHSPLGSQVVAQHRHRTSLASSRLWAPRCIADEQNLVVADELESKTIHGPLFFDAHIKVEPCAPARLILRDEYAPLWDNLLEVSLEDKHTSRVQRVVGQDPQCRLQRLVPSGELALSLVIARVVAELLPAVGQRIRLQQCIVAGVAHHEVVGDARGIDFLQLEQAALDRGDVDVSASGVSRLLDGGDVRVVLVHEEVEVELYAIGFDGRPDLTVTKVLDGDVDAVLLQVLVVHSNKGSAK